MVSVSRTAQGSGSVFCCFERDRAIAVCAYLAASELLNKLFSEIELSDKICLKLVESIVLPET